jgi:molybdopterin synthase sulfur carrier subunit
MPVVLVPTAYRGPTRGEAEISVEGTTVLECLQAVEARFQGFLAQVLDARGAVHGFVKLFVNGQQIESSALAMELAAEDQLEVLAAIAGG